MLRKMKKKKSPKFKYLEKKNDLEIWWVGTVSTKLELIRLTVSQIMLLSRTNVS